MFSTRRFSDIVYCIDSETRIWNGHIVPTDFLPFANLVECQASDALAEEYVVHRLFEPESELSREEFGVFVSIGFMSPSDAACLCLKRTMAASVTAVLRVGCATAQAPGQIAQQQLHFL